VVIDKRSKGEANVQGSSSDDGNISLIIISRHIDIFYFERTDDMVCYYFIFYYNKSIAICTLQFKLGG
jgi:hypothetical protein